MLSFFEDNWLGRTGQNGQNLAGLQFLARGGGGITTPAVPPLEGSRPKDGEEGEDARNRVYGAEKFKGPMSTVGNADFTLIS